MFSFSPSRSVVPIELRNSYSFITLTFSLSLCPGNLFLFKNPISVNSLSPRFSAAMVLSNMACRECWKCLTKEYLPLFTQTGPMILCVMYLSARITGLCVPTILNSSTSHSWIVTQHSFRCLTIYITAVTKTKQNLLPT